MKAIEQELKYRLTPKEHHKLLHSFRKLHKEKKNQVNVYFDTSDLDLRKKRIALRVRFYEKSPKAVLTFKRSVNSKTRLMPGFKEREEREILISVSQAKALTKKFNLSLISLPIRRILKRELSVEVLASIKSLGRIKNQRILVPILPKLNLEIDHFTVFGKHFYELEIETSDPKTVDQWVRKTFKKNKITYHPEERSKLRRFIDGWTKRK